MLPLLQDQASGYAQQFDEPGPAVLLFICPEVRIQTSWIRQIKSGSRWELETIDSSTWRHGGLGWILVQNLQLVIVSWVRLLRTMDDLAGDDIVRSDIRQLRGLAQSTGRAGIPSDSLRRTEPWPRAS